MTRHLHPTTNSLLSVARCELLVWFSRSAAMSVTALSLSGSGKISWKVHCNRGNGTTHPHSCKWTVGNLHSLIEPRALGLHHFFYYATRCIRLRLLSLPCCWNLRCLLLFLLLCMKILLWSSLSDLLSTCVSALLSIEVWHKLGNPHPWKQSSPVEHVTSACFYSLTIMPFWAEIRHWTHQPLDG